MMMLPHAIITVSLITALLPRLSRHAHNKDTQAFGDQLTDTIRHVAAFIIPSAALLVISGPSLGVLLYGHGATNQQQGCAIGLIASMFALGLPAFSIFYALLRSYYARENTKTPFFINLLFNALHIGVGSILFVSTTGSFKVASLALAYAFGYTVVCATTWRKLAREMPALKDPRHLRSIVQVAFASLISCILTVGVHSMIFSTYLGASAVSTLIRLSVDGTIFTITFYLLARKLHIAEVTTAGTLIRKRFAK